MKKSKKSAAGWGVGVRGGVCSVRNVLAVGGEVADGEADGEAALPVELLHGDGLGQGEAAGQGRGVALGGAAVGRDLGLVVERAQGGERAHLTDAAHGDLEVPLRVLDEGDVEGLTEARGNNLES